MISTVGALGLGKLIGFLFIWIDGKLRKHYVGNDTSAGPLIGPDIRFFDKELIANLKGAAWTN